MDITLDSNVLVYAFVPPIHKNKKMREEWKDLHGKAKKIYEDIVEEKHRLILPFAVIVEVASVISMLTGKEEYGKDAALEIEDSAMMVLFDSDLKDRALDYAVKIKAGGFDNLIAITSILYGTTLITNDKPFYDKLAPFSDEYQFKVTFFRNLNIDALKL
ncbi:MAG: PIN domain-containing protein [Candidatus Methanoperedens sp.]|nr:PIN domain-containing protein [Candidatus Methanoperedens sp.]